MQKTHLFKTTIVFFIILIFQPSTINSFAQAPESFNYQAVVRDASGAILASQSVKFRISVLQGSATGILKFSETHLVTTNSFGLANLIIGTGTLVKGSMSTIDWGSYSHFLKVEVDPAGGSSYTILASTQLLSVPYALHAKTVDPSSLSGIASPWTITDSDISYETGNVGIGTPASTYASLYVMSPQTAVVGMAKGSTYGTGGSFSTTATTGEGVFGTASSQTGNNYGGKFVSKSTGGTGLYGEASSKSGYTIGGNFRNLSPDGTGVLGFALSSTGINYGGKFFTHSSTGYSGYFSGGKFYVSGNVGIGTDSPSSKLDVTGVIRATGNVWPTAGAGVEIGYNAAVGRGYIQSYDRNKSSWEDLAIGAGDVYPIRNEESSLGLSGSKWKAVYAVNGTIQTSDVRMKKDITDLHYGLNTLMKLRPVSYRWKNGQGGLNLGLIAQEVQTLIPEVVDVGDDEIKTLGMKYTDLIPVLINAIKEQQEMIDRLKSENSALETRLSRIEAAVNAQGSRQ